MRALDVIAQAIQPGKNHHGQRCPVYREDRDLFQCNCWIKSQVLGKAAKALQALFDEGFEVTKP